MKPAGWLAIALLAGVAIGIAWPPPPIPRSQKAENATWSLPTADSLLRLPPDAAAQVSQGLRWADEADNAGDGAAEGPWKLVGIMRGPAPAALVQLATGKIEQYAEGTTLPGGSRLTRIDGDEVTIDREGCAQLYRLHHPPPAENSDCLTGQ